MQTLTSQQLTAQINNSPKPTLVKFEAEWCGHCKRFQPALDAASDTLAGRVDVVKIDIDKSRDLVQRLGIRSVPTIILFGAKGKELARSAGTMNSTQIVQWVKNYAKI